MTDGSLPDTVAIGGASGMIGSALSAYLRRRGTTVIHLVRRAPSTDVPDQVREVGWAPDQGRLDPAELEGVDAVVNLSGAGIGDRRWSDSYREQLLSSRLDSTGTLISALTELDPVPQLLSGSAVGYYGDRGDEVLTEHSPAGTGFLAELCRQWEAATAPAQAAGAAVAHLRTGIVLSREGGAMARMLPLAKLGLAGPLGRGHQYWSWITLADVVRALAFLLTHPEITGPVNLAGPTPDPQRDVVAALGRRLNRPAFLPAPGFALRIALGGMASDILSSQRALPSVLTEAGFTHRHPTLPEAMAWLLAEC